jgi:predicted GNAT family acetyltransferase
MSNPLKLVHYSAQNNLSQIDPNKMGTSGISGAQYKRGLPENKTSFFYTHDSNPEDMVLQNSHHKYTAELGPQYKVYDADSDPQNLKQLARSKNGGAWNEDVFHDTLKEKGYHGLKWEMRPQTHVVQMYVPVNVQKELKKNDEGIKSNHLIFSAEKPLHQAKLKTTHEQMLNQLKSQGEDAHQVLGKYGQPEKSIIVFNPKNTESIKSHLKDLGQESLIESNGNDHKLIFLNGPKTGKMHTGTGTVVHAEAPEDYFTTLPSGKTFTHNISFDTLHPVNKSLKKATNLEKGINGDWKKDPNYTFHHTDMPDSDELVGHHNIDVRYKNKPIASLRYFRQSDFGDDQIPYLIPAQTNVSPKHQRKGLASAMYSYAEKIHKLKMRPSSNQTPQAEALWSQPNRPFGKSEMKTHLDDNEFFSEDLQKTPLSEDEAQLAEEWSEHPHHDKRNVLHEQMMHPSHKPDRVTMIKDLAKEAKTKKIGNDWHVELYRGIGAGEHPEDYKHETRSFTYDPKVAAGFADQYNGQVVKQWIPLQHISYSFNHAHKIGGVKNTANPADSEVIVGPIPKAGKNLKKSESLQKTPQVSDIYEDVSWGSGFHPSKEAKYHKTLTHKDGTKIHVFKKPDDEYDGGTFYTITADNNPKSRPISTLEVSHYDPMSGEDSPHISKVSTDEEHQGNGYATLLHRAALNDYKQLKSDNRLSPASNHIWNKLSQDPRYKVTLADPNSLKTRHTAVMKSESSSLKGYTQDNDVYHIKSLTKSQDIVFCIDDEESGELNKTQPRVEGESHPSQPWVAVKNHVGNLMWHANKEQARNIDSTLKNPTLVGNFLKTVPQSHQATVSKIINNVANDPNRHFIPTADNGKEKLRARHIRSLLLGTGDVSVDHSTPDVLKITRKSHSQQKTYPSFVFNYRFGDSSGIGKSEENDGRSAFGAVQDVSMGLGPEFSLHPRRDGLRNESSGAQVTRPVTSNGRRNNSSRGIADGYVYRDDSIVANSSHETNRSSAGKVEPRSVLQKERTTKSENNSEWREEAPERCETEQMSRGPRLSIRRDGKRLQSFSSIKEDSLQIESLTKSDKKAETLQKLKLMLESNNEAEDLEIPESAVLYSAVQPHKWGK